MWRLGLMLIFTLACAPTSPLVEPSPSSEQALVRKITFDIGQIDANGLIGPADAKRSVAYEFCIPRDDAMRTEVSRIDPSVQFYAGTPGRIRCRPDQYLVIGQGATAPVLLRLASLSYIQRIDPYYGE